MSSVNLLGVALIVTMTAVFTLQRRVLRLERDFARVCRALRRGLTSDPTLAETVEGPR